MSWKSIRIWTCFFLVAGVLHYGAPATAAMDAFEAAYHRLRAAARSDGDTHLYLKINRTAATLDWKNGKPAAFDGYIRHLKQESAGAFQATNLFLLRSSANELYIISIPEDPAQIGADADTPYAGLADMVKNKLHFQVRTAQAVVDGHSYTFVRFTDKPEISLLGRLFKLSITLLLFFIMLGMGLTLTWNDFALVLKKPRGMLIGTLLQWIYLPLVAVLLGRLLGFHDAYPFIYVGLVLVTVSPGGVMSNLLTHFAKGDLALSISLTSLSTVLSLFFTPLLMAAYCANVPDIVIPVKLIVGSIVVLVLAPLTIGMFIRKHWPRFAEKSVKFFSLLGLGALVFIITVGLIMGGDFFSDTQRYGVSFYTTLFVLTLAGMAGGAAVPKLFGINNFQTRAISLESGLRNTGLSMTIALLMQDAMGDFYSSMFFTSALFGLWMFVAATIAMLLFRPLLPVAVSPPATPPAAYGRQSLETLDS